MDIEVRLFANLNKYLPAGTVGRRVRLALPPGATIAALLGQLHIPTQLAHLVAVNGRHQQDREFVLSDGDQISVFPPLAGGATPRIVVKVSNDPLDLNGLAAAVADDSAGAIATFTGVVRNHTLREGKRKEVSRLHYEAYPKMAEDELRKICVEMNERWGLCKIAIQHRIEVDLPVGQASVIIAVSAAHRQDAFAACAYAMDRIKQTVPIWKKEFAKDGEWWVEGPAVRQGGDD